MRIPSTDISQTNAVAYAKKLKARLAELQRELDARREKHEVEVIKWRKALATWLRTEGVKRASRFAPPMESPSKYNRDDALYPLLRGAPLGPVKPSDPRIKKIQTVLRAIAVTGQARVTPRAEEIEFIFGDLPKADGDDSWADD